MVKKHIIHCWLYDNKRLNHQWLTEPTNDHTNDIFEHRFPDIHMQQATIGLIYVEMGNEITYQHFKQEAYSYLLHLINPTCMNATALHDSSLQ